MYLRTLQRRRQDGSTVRYFQLAHNHWNPASGQSKVEVLYNFGREDQLDRDGIARLVSSLARVLPPGQALATAAGEGLQFLESRPLGGAWLLDQLWRRLGIQKLLLELLRDRRLEVRAERVIFAMVCNRVLDPLSKLACTSWIKERVFIPGLKEVDEDHCYRAMDWLLEIEPELTEQIYWALADLLNLEVDLLFFDTTSTYFESDQADAPSPGAEKGFRTYNQHSKDHRPDLPQVVIGMAVTRTGIPIRVWCWPGNASDQELIRQVKDDLKSWKLGRVVWVADRGFNSAQNRRYLQRGGGHYILAEKLRGESKEAQAALSRQGRYQVVAENLEIKEVVIDEGTLRDRFVICRNPEEAERDALVRNRILTQLEAAIAGSDQLSLGERTRLAAQLQTQPGLRRFLRVTKQIRLRIDRAAVAAEEHLDGKFLLRTSDPTLSAEDVALGYKQLYQIERAWREMKTTLELRPVYHRKEGRIRAHVILCWLGLLLIRITENGTQETWRNVRNECQLMHLGRFRGPAGEVLQRTDTTHQQLSLFQALEIPEPPHYLGLTPGSQPAPD